MKEKLKDRCVKDQQALEIVRQRAESAWGKFLKTNDDAYIDSVALNLHGFYQGVEKMLMYLLEYCGSELPEGSDWHKDLLLIAAMEIPKRRPALISVDTLKLLDDFRGFRHVIRNIYTFNLSPERVRILVEKLPGCLSQFALEVNQFVMLFDE